MHGVDRRVIREELERTRKYWDKVNGPSSAGAIADEVIKILADRYRIAVLDSDWH